jgi:uncharacterized RDD family membrane protein YckC
MVERIADAPEVRQAIASQSIGLLGDIGRQIAKVARDLDNTFERIVRRIFFRRRRPLPTNRAGVVSRGLAFGIDALIINLFFTVLAGAATLIVTFLGGSGEGVPKGAIAAGSFIWLAVVSVYLAGFWGLEGQTIGMRFLGIRLSERRLPLRRAIRRLLGLGLSVITFGIGFLGIVFGEGRRGWADRMAGTEVVYDDRKPVPAPWSTLSETGPVAPSAGATPLAEPLPPSALGAVTPPAGEAPKPGPQSGSAGSAAPAA